MAVMWISHVVRITALILIGVAGAPHVAISGFHSQAGWIAFTCVALSFAVFSRHFTWFSTEPRAKTQLQAATHNPTAAYLMPFVIVLAAGMVSTAALEWLRVAVPAAGGCSRHYDLVFPVDISELNWRFGWLSAVAGLAVFLIWLGLDRFSGAHLDSPIGPGLASLASGGRLTWLLFSNRRSSRHCPDRRRVGVSRLFDPASNFG